MIDVKMENVKKCSKCKELKYHEEFYLNNATKDNLTLHCKKCQSKYDKNKKKRSYFVRYRVENKDKKYAHAIANRAIKAGILIRPDHCENCFKKCKPVAHHENYKKQLEVDFICRTCHSARHKVIDASVYLTNRLKGIEA